MLLYTMLYIVLAYLMLFAALTNSVCLNNASFFFLFNFFLCQGYELSGEIALKNNHYYYYYYYYYYLVLEAQQPNIIHRHSACHRDMLIPPLLSHNFSSCSTDSPIFHSHFQHAIYFENFGVILLTPAHLPCIHLSHCTHNTELVITLKLQTPHGSTLLLDKPSFMMQRLTIILVFKMITFKPLLSKASSHFKNLFLSALIVPHIWNKSTAYNNSLSALYMANSVKHLPPLQNEKVTKQILGAFYRNYRPVSNLCFIAKILEKLVLSQVSSYLNSHNHYNTCQSAYRPGHSTETALLKVVNDLFLSHNKGNISVLALLDFSSAFDTIDHPILVHRLHTDFGFTDTVLQWFSSYLTDRTHYISLSNHCSAFTHVHSGVPQGSVLGPILFTMYIKPLSAIIDSHCIIHHSFADDL